MSTSEKPNLVVVENTRRVTVRLADGVTLERFVELLNKRHVKITGDHLSDGYSGEVLGQYVSAVNACDYKIPSDQCPLPPLDTLDIYNFDYNRI